MPGKPLTPEQAERGRAQEARLKSGRTRQAKNALTWLRRQIERSKLPDEVKARIDKLFDSLGPPMKLYLMDEDTAQREAFRIGARIHWLRSTHRMLGMDPGDSGFMGVSKTAMQWTLIDAKLNRPKGKGEKGQKDRKPVPTARSTQGQSQGDEPDNPEE